MNKKEIINNFDNPKEFNEQYNYFLNFNKNKIIKEEKFKKYKSGRFLKLKNNYYVKLPRFSKKVSIIIATFLTSFIVTGISLPIAILYMPHKVTLNSNYLMISKSNTARLSNDYKCTFKVKDDIIASQYMNNISINSVKVNGKEIPIEDYSFIYQTNIKNELTIKKKYLNGNIEINADLTTRTQKQNCFWYEYNIVDYSNFTDLKVSIPQGEDKIIHIKLADTEEEYLTKFAFAFEFENEHFDIVDNVLMRHITDVVLVDKKTYTFTYREKTYSISLPFDTIFVREDNAVKFDIKAEKGKTLPKNLWIRSNARYTKKGVDFNLNFKNDYKEATIEIPYYVIRDNGSITINPNVEVK